MKLPIGQKGNLEIYLARRLKCVLGAFVLRVMGAS